MNGFFKLNDLAKVPRKAHPADAGYDLCAIGDYVVDRGQVVVVCTGVGVALPFGHYGRVAGRSGLGAKGLDVLAGVVDQGYRGEIRIVVVNHGPYPIELTEGSRVAQLIVEKVYDGELGEIDEFPTAETDRGARGFGSTGT